MITQQIIVNPGFEIQGNLDGSDLTRPNPDPAGWVMDPGPSLMQPYGYSGQWCAKLSGNRSLYQTVDVPEFSTSHLTCILSLDTDLQHPDNAVDKSCTLTAMVQDTWGNPLKTLAVWDASDLMVGNGWFSAGPFEISEFANRTIRVVFKSDQTDVAKNLGFAIDDVRLQATLNLPVSSFPPLISDRSLDKYGAIQQYGSAVLCSCTIQAEAADPFSTPLPPASSLDMELMGPTMSMEWRIKTLKPPGGWRPWEVAIPSVEVLPRYFQTEP